MGPGAAPTPAPQAHIVGPEVWVVLLDAVVQDRNHDALARKPLAPDLQDVQVRLHLLVLCKAGPGSVGLWPGLAPPPSPASSPCTTAWRTRGPWAPPRSVSPAAAPSAAGTTAPGGGETTPWEGLDPRAAHPPPSFLPSHQAALEGPAPQPFHQFLVKAPKSASRVWHRPLPWICQGSAVWG